MKPSGWDLKVRAVMDAQGITYWEACGVLGRRGGVVSGARRASKAKAISSERRKQEAMRLR